MPHLSLTMFGSFQVRIDGLPINNFDSVKTRALLAYLADDPGRPHLRSTLAELLWPGRMENVALSNLRHALTYLRHTIRDIEAVPCFLLIDRETIALNPRSACEADIWDFRQLINKTSECNLSDNLYLACLEKIISLYQGSFLDNFMIMIKGCPGFEEWVLARRESYSSEVLEILNRLIETYLKLGQYKKGEIFARRSLEIAPWREEAYRQLMIALALEGKRSEALAQYKICQGHLDKELGVEPSQETQQLFFLIRTESLSVYTGYANISRR